MNTKEAAENNFIRLARAYEILSDDKLKRRRYDVLLTEGILEYPDNLNYDWEWVDQKIGLSKTPFQNEHTFWTRGASRTSAYEEAKKFYEAEKQWTWENDTTIQDIKDNPIIIFILIVILCVFCTPRKNSQWLIKGCLAHARKKKFVDNIVKKSKINEGPILGTNNNHHGASRKTSKINVKPSDESVDGHESDDELDVEFVRMDLIILLKEHMSDIISIFSADSIDWRSIDPSMGITAADIVYASGKIDDAETLNMYADCIVRTFPCREPHINDTDSGGQVKEIDESGENEKVLHNILETFIDILDERNVMKLKIANSQCKSKAKLPVVNELKKRTWTSASIECLVKGTNKFQSHRKKWDLVADYMNRILSPDVPLTKLECIQQAQKIHNYLKTEKENSKVTDADARLPRELHSQISEGKEYNSADSNLKLSKENDNSSSVTAWNADQQRGLG